MAMEKLILRSVMYGVDKIPDSWFDKVPGGFYKSSQMSNQKKQGSQKIDDGERGKKQRRYSHNQDDRRRARRDRYEDEYRSDDTRRNERRGRSSYDGSHDDDFSRDDRRGGGRDSGRRRRRHSVDSDRYGYNDGYSKNRDHAHYSDQKNQGSRQPRPADPYFDEGQRPVTSDSSRGANQSPGKAALMSGGLAGAAAGTDLSPVYARARGGSVNSASMPSPRSQVEQAQATERPRSGSMATGYVPYAHIYGQTDTRAAPSFPPPPIAANSAPQPGFTSPLHPQQIYPQNRSTQPVPSGADSATTTATYAPPPMRPPTSDRGIAGYENIPPYPESPRPSRAADRYSPSYATSQERRDSDGRRTRSERRPDSSEKSSSRYYGKIQSRTLSKSRPQADSRCTDKNPYVDPRAPLQGQVQMPSPPPPKDTRRDSALEQDPRHSRRHDDRGYHSD